MVKFTPTASSSRSEDDVVTRDFKQVKPTYSLAMRNGPPRVQINDFFSASEDESEEDFSSFQSSLVLSPRPPRPTKAPTSATKENQPHNIHQVIGRSLKQSQSAPTSPMKTPTQKAPAASTKSFMNSRSTLTPQMSMDRELGTISSASWKVKFEMPKLAADGRSESFYIEHARKHLKKTRSVLKSSKDRKKEELLSMRVMNLPVDRSVNEDKVDEIIVKLLDDAAGFKLKSVSFKGQTYEAFSGEQLAKWIGGNLYLDAEESVQYAQTTLMNRGVFISLSTKHQSFHPKKDYYYAFKANDPVAPLNAVKFHLEEVLNPVGLSKSLVKLAAKMLDENRTIDGKIAFASGRNSKSYYRLSVLSARLQMVNLEAMSPQERSAFYINVYNAMCLHSRFASGMEPKEKVERKALSYKLYLIAQATWGPEDLLSSLRGVFAKGPAGCHPVLACLLFDGSDRTAPIAAYDSTDFEGECLKASIAGYLQKNMTVDTLQQIVFLPKIFKTIGPDFGTTEKEIFMELANLTNSNYLREYAELLEIRYYEPTFDRMQLYVV